MGTVVLLAISLGLLVYAYLLSLPRFSPRTAMIRRLGQAPPPRRLTPGYFRLLQATLTGGALLAVAWPWLSGGRAPDWVALALWPPVLWALPAVWLWLQIRRRRALIARTYPDLLACLAAQTRAGAGALAAFAGCPPVLREPLRSEVETLVADLRTAPLPDALLRFADRCDTPVVRIFARNVIYQMSLGFSLADVLAQEEAHALAMLRQAVRRRRPGARWLLASATVILLLNGLLVYFLPQLHLSGR